MSTDRRLVSTDRLRLPSTTNKAVNPIRRSSAGVQGHMNHNDRDTLCQNSFMTSMSFFLFFQKYFRCFQEFPCAMSDLGAPSDPAWFSKRQALWKSVTWSEMQDWPGFHHYSATRRDKFHVFAGGTSGAAIPVSRFPSIAATRPRKSSCQLREAGAIMSKDTKENELQDEKLLLTLVSANRQRRKRQPHRRKKNRDWTLQVYDSSDKNQVNVVLSDKIAS